jgi:hypothetical protein
MKIAQVQRKRIRERMAARKTDKRMDNGYFYIRTQSPQRKTFRNLSDLRALCGKKVFHPT